MFGTMTSTSSTELKSNLPFRLDGVTSRQCPSLPYPITPIRLIGWPASQAPPGLPAKAPHVRAASALAQPDSGSWSHRCRVRKESQSQMAEAHIAGADAQMSQLPVWTPAPAPRGNSSLCHRHPADASGFLAHKVKRLNFGSKSYKSELWLLQGQVGTLVLKVISLIFASESKHSERSWW